MNWWFLTSVVDNTFSWLSGGSSSNPVHANLHLVVIFTELINIKTIFQLSLFLSCRNVHLVVGKNYSC